MFYKCHHFGIFELVDQPTFVKFGEAAWQFFHPDILISLDKMRDYFNKPITVNNWHEKGLFSERGLRILNPKDTNIYSPYSAHSLGAAMDFDVEGMSAVEVRGIIIDHKDDEIFSLINRIEDKVDWVHADVFNVPSRIEVFQS